jgi:predicted DNA-binding protein (UPF0251 family)
VDEKRKPALQPQMHEAEKRMISIEVKMEAFAPLQFELQHFSLSIAPHEVSAARLHASKNGD